MAKVPEHLAGLTFDLASWLGTALANHALRADAGVAFEGATWGTGVGRVLAAAIAAYRLVAFARAHIPSHGLWILVRRAVRDSLVACVSHGVEVGCRQRYQIAQPEAQRADLEQGAVGVPFAGGIGLLEGSLERLLGAWRVGWSAGVCLPRIRGR